MKKYGIGVIGLGMGSGLLLINNVSSSNLEVIGVCDIVFDKAEKLKQEYNLKYAVKDYKELIEKEDIDIIAVFSPDHLHAEQCIAALEAGKHVICTKPMVTSIRDAKKIVKLVDEKKLKFLTGQTMRYNPEFTAIKKMYDDGDLGEIIIAEAHYVHDLRPVFKMTPWRMEVPQDVMYGGTCHPVDALRWFLGDVEEVFAYGVKGNINSGYPLKANYLLNLKFKNGVIARVLAAFDIIHPPMPEMGISIFGSKGSAIGEFTDYLPGKTKVVLDKFEGNIESVMVHPAETVGAYGHGYSVKRFLNHFDYCLENNLIPSPSVRDGAKAISVCEAAWESIESGKPVKVFNGF
jgi:predicted dehydrogenase